jgi:acetyltransferase-like isoleucine patch superfamily enzyme
MSDERFKNWKPPEIEERKLNEYNWIVQNKDNLKLGYKTDIGAFTYINAKNGVTIEDYVQIGSHCSIYSISTIDNKEGPIVLKKNSKIGTHSVVMPNVTVGENSIIGAFSFVNRDIPENTIAFGTPAKVIRKLNEKEIKELGVEETRSVSEPQILKKFEDSL